MIIQGLLNPIIDVLSGLISLLPSANIELPIEAALSWTNVIRHSAYFFPMNWLGIILLNWMAWWTVFMSWAIIEWVYKKIPGVS